VIGFSLIAPGLLLDAQSDLPACCRRNGVHHCIGNMDEAPSNSGISFQAIRQTCPSFGIAAPACANLALPKPSAAVFAALLSHPSIQFQTEACYRVSSSRSHQKRGPPLILS
jgi:hypothetical protein